jgi:antitoxin (DNA-binding transcriptional repressor) of toxin-antitoxin stability system
MAIGRRAAYIGRMTRYTLAQAETRLSELMDRALNGEGVVITRGKASVELKVVTQKKKSPRPRPMTEADWEWLRARRDQLPMMKEDAGMFVSRMRDEDWER